MTIADREAKWFETIHKLRTLLAEWVEDEQWRPFFHEEEHGTDSLLHRSRNLLKELNKEL